MYKVLWPRGRKARGAIRAAKRLDNLNGKTIGELWDWVFRGDELFPMMEKTLRSRYPDIKFASYKLFGSTHGSEEAAVLGSLSAKLREFHCDAVVSGMGC